MKVGIDTIWMFGNFRGMGKFAWKLIGGYNGDIIQLSPNDLARGNKSILFRIISFFPIWEQIILPLLASKNSLDYLICPYNTAPVLLSRKIKLILVVHDTIFMEPWKEVGTSTSWYQVLGRIYRRLIFLRSLNRAHVIVTVSRYSEVKIQEFLRSDHKQIHVIPNALDKSWFDTERERKKTDNFVLTVSGEQTTKNLKRLLEAYSLTGLGPNAKMRLKVVGVSDKQVPVFKKHCRDFEIEKFVDFLPFIRQRDLKKLYSTCNCFIFASTHEGFGIPLIEAMSSGAPIACSQASCIPEIVGDAALFFDPLSNTDMAEVIYKVVNDRYLSDKLTELGYTRVAEYAIENVSQQINSFWSAIR